MSEEFERSREEILDDLVDNGWTPASEPPDDYRIVRVAYEDGSTGPNALAFWDTKEQIPEPPPCWWSADSLMPLPDGVILAWREKDDYPNNDLEYRS
jgi:hypothetical protein